MIDLDFAATQAARFSALANFPELREGRTELAKTLARISLSREHCTAIADAALENCKFSPAPAELAQFARDLAPEFRTPEPEGCKYCSCGWRTGLFLITWNNKRATFEPITKTQAEGLRSKLDVHTQMIYSAVTECTCAAGKRQKELAATRAALQAAKGERTRFGGNRTRRISRSEVSDLLSGTMEAQ